MDGDLRKFVKCFFYYKFCTGVRHHYVCIVLDSYDIDSGILFDLNVWYFSTKRRLIVFVETSEQRMPIWELDVVWSYVTFTASRHQTRCMTHGVIRSPSCDFRRQLLNVVSTLSCIVRRHSALYCPLRSTLYAWLYSSEQGVRLTALAGARCTFDCTHRSTIDGIDSVVASLVALRSDSPD